MNANDENRLTILKDQYLALLQIYDNEQSRFWTRFNIFIGFQTALIIGIVSANGFVFSNPFILKRLLFFGVILSMLGIIVIARCISINNDILKTLLAVENESKGELIILKTYSSVTKIPLYVNGLIALCLGIVFLIFWMSGFFFTNCIIHDIVISK